MTTVMPPDLQVSRAFFFCIKVSESDFPLSEYLGSGLEDFDPEVDNFFLAVRISGGVSCVDSSNLNTTAMSRTWPALPCFQGGQSGRRYLRPGKLCTVQPEDEGTVRFLGVQHPERRL